MCVRKAVTGYGDEAYGYDAAGNRISLRKRDGSTLTYQYDSLNRMIVKVVPERAGLAAAHTRDVHYDYDVRGLMTKARFDSLAGEGVTNVYDGFGRLVSSSSSMGGTARTVGNGYDAGGNRVRITHPDTSYFTYEPDGAGRLVRVRENGGDPIVAFAYDSAGRRSGLTSGGTSSGYGYDSASRLQTLTHDLAGTSRDHALGFTYNPASQIVARTASNDAFAWTGAANVSRPYAVNGLNQYTSAGPATFAHDPNGNLASTVNAPWSTSYVYDVENRLVSATGAHTAELVYDPLGRLFQVSTSTTTRRLVYDGDALVAEYDVNGNMPHRYIHGNDSGADDPLVWYDNWNSGWRRALVADHQGSVIQVADMYGNPIATNTYDSWGIPGATPAGRFGYTGQTWVPELGLWYYKARFYSPTLGRFLQVDPVGYDDQINLYAYVGNDPVNHIDTNGRQARRVLPFPGTMPIPGVPTSGDRDGNGFNDADERGARGLQQGIDYVRGLPGRFIDWVFSSDTPEYTDIPGRIPWRGEPGSTVRGPWGSRTYGPDGYPQTDRDSPHPDHAGVSNDDHVHDWTRPADGGPPVAPGQSQNPHRGPARAPRPGDPPQPRGNENRSERHTCIGSLIARSSPC